MKFLVKITLQGITEDYYSSGDCAQFVEDLQIRLSVAVPQSVFHAGYERGSMFLCATIQEPIKVPRADRLAYVYMVDTLTLMNGVVRDYGFTVEAIDARMFKPSKVVSCHDL